MKCKASHQIQSGLTLIELLITLAILGVLSAVAYPTYTQHTREAYRMIALGDMLEMQLELERSYSAGYDFTRVISNGRCFACESEWDRYQFKVVSSADAAYTIIALAQAGTKQTQDTCLKKEGVMTIDSNGIALPEACWK
ncbi:prepilin-type N-terminal cleavage/methylation domain-containing protein [Vibrio sp. 10N.286.49.C2]|uniref:type IV pilin protein n=1 Tax=unclassified Vibrio TaxID=2614977 RepID=UPI000C860D78|nr:MULTISPECIES: type IV pilin protein [unclassified Vibrio]PMH36297.1 prepilin-type N-terminal cleavage/methylation domain-containing protein [Vibrio sp. 10N.286.49.C2]PMH53413.1 prepilin-type N-terminal cleavage/methylation domain-containing protein [Vibrio sp. 10N.286.49.B1]PMH80697.1 prepilin-type N-terminal cleavage/methylation domain-containing protein [Vibrio sp. 10N.286.48.B7]